MLPSKMWSFALSSSLKKENGESKVEKSEFSNQEASLTFAASYGRLFFAAGCGRLFFAAGCGLVAALFGRHGAEVVLQIRVESERLEQNSWLLEANYECCASCHPKNAFLPSFRVRAVQKKKR